MKMKRKTNYYFTLLFILIINICKSQGLYGGIEIGGKGVKVTVLNITNIQKGEYVVKDFLTENVSLSKGISRDGNLRQDDMMFAVQLVKKNYKRLIEEFNLDKKRIHIIASSGVAMGKNIDELGQKVKEALGVDMDVINVDQESKLLISGGVHPDKYTDALIIDIGGGNTKGGYVDIKNLENLVFYPVSLKLGTVTLTEKIKMKATSDEFSDFLQASTIFKDTIKNIVKGMYQIRPQALSKKNIYFSGGAAWAFKTLMSTKPIENYSEFSLKDVKDYQMQLVFDFKKFEDLAQTNPEVKRVLDTYNQSSLLAANSLLLSTIENLDKPNEKKYYFIKNGQMAWLVAYVLQSAKHGKIIY